MAGSLGIHSAYHGERVYQTLQKDPPNQLTIFSAFHSRVEEQFRLDHKVILVESASCLTTVTRIIPFIHENTVNKILEDSKKFNTQEGERAIDTSFLLANLAMFLSPEESSCFSSSTLHQFRSQPKFIAHQASYLESPSKLNNGGFNIIYSPIDPASSSTPSPPRTFQVYSSASLYASTHAIPEGQDDEDQIVFPSCYDGQIEDPQPLASPRTGNSYAVSLTSNSTSTTVSRQEPPDLAEHAVDDISVRKQPFRHVDYLSHSWKEEDIWSSWKYIVSQRKAYNNSARLENASWRTWAKLKNNLETVSPESLNW